jgi:hypothetical protein
VLALESVPGADDAWIDGLDPPRLIDSVRAAFEGRPLRAVAISGYDMNDDESGVTTGTVLALIEAAAETAGGVPRPETVGGGGG